MLAHLDMLYAVALRLTRNPADAQDLTQNTVVKALRFHDKFAPGTYIKAWLLTILRNTFINEYRRAARTPPTVEWSDTEPRTERSREPTVSVEPPRRGIEELLDLVGDEVRAAVESLPPDFRQVVVMADLLDMSYKEVAEAVGCPIGTVMSRLFRGRRLLRERLYDYARDRRMVENTKSSQRKKSRASSRHGRN